MASTIIPYGSRLLTASLRILPENNPSSHLPIHLAIVRKLSVDHVLELIEQYPSSCEHRDSLGNLPIHAAAAHDADIVIAKKLSEMYVNSATIGNGAGNLPLHVAVFNKSSFEMVKLLYEAFPDAVFTANSAGNLPIHLAAINCTDINVTKFLLEANVGGCEEPNMAGWLPLHCTMLFHHNRNDQLNLIRSIAKAYPAAVHVSTVTGGTPIDLSIARQNSELWLRILLGADVIGLTQSDLSKFKSLNWKYRKSGLRIFVHIICNTTAYGDTDNSLVRAVNRFCNLEANGNNVVISNVLLRQIIFFL